MASATVPSKLWVMLLLIHCLLLLLLFCGLFSVLPLLYVQCFVTFLVFNHLTVSVLCLLLAVSRVGLQCVIVVFLGHTHLHFEVVKKVNAKMFYSILNKKTDY